MSRAAGESIPHTPTGWIVFLLLVVMVFWGGSFIAIKVGLRHLGPMELVAARFIPSALMLLPIAFLARRKSSRNGFWQHLSRQDRWLTILCSFLAVPGYHICLNYGETLIPAGWASLVISLNPACIAIWAALLLKEHIPGRRIVGLAVAFAGLLVIALTGQALADDRSEIPLGVKAFGLFVTLGAVIGWGGFTVISKRLITGRSPIEGLTWFIGLGSLWTLPFVSLDFIRLWLDAPAELWWAILFLSAGCTVISFIIWFWVLSHWPASRAGLFIYAVPVLALVMGWGLLGESLSPGVVLGAVVVIGGVLLAMREMPPASQLPPPEGV
ncbi:MAG: DMT family transporter [Calditrichaeota bacterium]|nr:DMT family transporter [Calditrichota bacterium]